jgi:hypothetical protein
MTGESRQPGWPPEQNSTIQAGAAGATSEVPSDPCLTFDQARVLAVRHMELQHPLDHHRHYGAAANGWQNTTHWHVRVDEARFIHTGDQQYMLVGTPEVLVDKATGEVTTVAYLSAPALFAAMTTAHEHLRHPGSRGSDRIRHEGHVPRPVPVWLVLAPSHPA